jgi:hypothetical protein
MGSVDADHVGVASGINNALSRVGGLLSVALFGLLLLSAFNHSLDQRLPALDLPPQARQAVDAQRDRLAAAQIPPGIDPATSSQLKLAIDAAFVEGFRLVMLISCGLALASSACTVLTIRGGRPGP